MVNETIAANTTTPFCDASIFLAANDFPEDTSSTFQMSGISSFTAFKKYEWNEFGVYPGADLNATKIACAAMLPP